MTRMIRLTLVAALGASLLPGIALADGNGKWQRDRDHSESRYASCPPGLAKKNNGCLPHGQARKYRYDDRRWHDDDHRERHVERWRRGERIRGDYVLVRDPRRYGLDPRHTYWRSQGYVYRVDRKTGEVLALIGLARSILGN